jgi:hypothetical protein
MQVRGVLLSLEPYPLFEWLLLRAAPGKRCRWGYRVSYQQRKAEEFAHPLFQEKVRHGQLVFIQARLLARALRSDTDYTPHLFT